MLLRFHATLPDVFPRQREAEEISSRGGASLCALMSLAPPDVDSDVDWGGIAIELEKYGNADLHDDSKSHKKRLQEQTCSCSGMQNSDTPPLLKLQEADHQVLTNPSEGRICL